MDTTTETWTRPFHGVTHYGELKHFRRATINTLRDNLHILKRIERPADSPSTFTEETFRSLKAAKLAGEAWSHCQGPTREADADRCPTCGHKKK